MWHNLKVFIKEETKPKNSAELLNGIMTFWNTRVTIEYCNAKIDHVEKRVIKVIIRLKGKATGL